jgi:hypothetical protein
MGCKTEELPPEIPGESKPHKFCSLLRELALKRLDVMMEIVSGSVHFGTVVTTVHQSNDYDNKDNKRHLSDHINYLRVALLAIAFPWFFPPNMTIGLFGGHISPVVAVFLSGCSSGDGL